MTPRTGRPPLEHARENVTRVRTTDAELAELQAAADRAGQPLSTWIRERALAAAKRTR